MITSINQLEKPDTSLMENTLTEDQCDELFDKIINVTESSDWRSSFKENFPGEYDQILKEGDGDFASMLFVGGAVVLSIIAYLVSWLKNKYRLRINKLYGQSKELNDIYTKVSDMLAHDKFARFRHRNDLVNCEIESIVLIDKKSSKIYRFIIDNLAYDSESVINELNNIVSYVDTLSKKQRTESIKTMTNNFVSNIQQSFMQRHGFVVTCNPMMRKTAYKNQKLDKVVDVYKSYVEFIYSAVYILNKNVAAQLQYLQLLQQAYKKMMNQYGKDKDTKEMVDTVFKQLIKNMTYSMDFNSRCTTILEEMANFYLEEFKTIYEIIRS